MDRCGPGHQRGVFAEPVIVDGKPETAANDNERGVSTFLLTFNQWVPGSSPIEETFIFIFLAGSPLLRPYLLGTAF